MLKGSSVVHAVVLPTSTLLIIIVISAICASSSVTARLPVNTLVVLPKREIISQPRIAPQKLHFGFWKPQIGRPPPNRASSRTKRSRQQRQFSPGFPPFPGPLPRQSIYPPSMPPSSGPFPMTSNPFSSLFTATKCAAVVIVGAIAVFYLLKSVNIAHEGAYNGRFSISFSPKKDHEKKGLFHLKKDPSSFLNIASQEQLIYRPKKPKKGVSKNYKKSHHKSYVDQSSSSSSEEQLTKYKTKFHHHKTRGKKRKKKQNIQAGSSLYLEHQKRLTEIEALLSVKKAALGMPLATLQNNGNSAEESLIRGESIGGFREENSGSRDYDEESSAIRDYDNEESSVVRDYEEESSVVSNNEEEESRGTADSEEETRGSVDYEEESRVTADEEESQVSTDYEEESRVTTTDYDEESRVTTDNEEESRVTMDYEEEESRGTADYEEESTSMTDSNSQVDSDSNSLKRSYTSSSSKNKYKPKRTGHISPSSTKSRYQSSSPENYHGSVKKGYSRSSSGTNKKGHRESSAEKIEVYHVMVPGRDDKQSHRYFKGDGKPWQNGHEGSQTISYHHQQNGDILPAILQGYSELFSEGPRPDIQHNYQRSPVQHGYPPPPPPMNHGAVMADPYVNNMGHFAGAGYHPPPVMASDHPAVGMPYSQPYGGYQPAVPHHYNAGPYPQPYFGHQPVAFGMPI